MVELAELVPFIGFGVAIMMPLLLKKIDFGKASRDRNQQDLDKIEERLRQAEMKLVKLERNNNK